MSRKRRMFDIEMPDEAEANPAAETPGSEPVSPAERRGPMASAVRENAEALRVRAEAERAIRAENDALAHEFVRLRGQGLVLSSLDIGEVRTNKLTRDRRDLDSDGLQELMDSIRAIGLSNPIQVEAAADGFELIQGLRRLSAYRALFEETGDAQYRSIPAVVLAEGETLELLYRRMVDENLIRSDISFAEMAALARSYAEDPGTSAESVDAAVQALYGSAGKQKRSYIRAFAKMMAVLRSAMMKHRLRHCMSRSAAMSMSARVPTLADSRAELG